MTTFKKFSLLSVFLIAALMALQLVVAPVALAEGQAGTTLSATINATAHLEKTFHWTIDKSVTPDTWDLFKGDSGTSEYTITVTKDEGTLTAWIDGQICVTNGGAVATENLAISADLTKPPSTTVLATTNVDLTAHPILAPGETFCYDYHIDYPAAIPGASYKVTSDITITNHSGHGGTPFGPGPAATVAFPASPDLVNDSINVDDTNGESWPFSDDGSVSYTKKFTCDDEGTNDNTATIRETGDEDSASVTVTCYELGVTKDVHTSFDRTYSWSVDKSADKDSLLLQTGESFVVNYEVVFSTTGSSDSNYAVSGAISVHNPAPIDATINAVSDLLSLDGAAAVDCGVSFPYTLVAGDTLNCTYSADLLGNSDQTNTATASLQNYDYDKDGIGTPSGTTDATFTADVTFTNTTPELIDECITVSDDFSGSTVTGEVCLNNSPATFEYTRTVKFDTCGDYTVENTASFETTDTHSKGSHKVSIPVSVPCAGGCTLTLGYWKTHSLRGPAPYDSGWLLIGPAGADTTFFLSGKSYYGVLWTPPAGNAYYNLAQQYIAATLNILNGAASTPAVDAALTWAKTQIFQVYTTTNVPSNKRSLMLSYAATLDAYNNGITGPGHCSEQTS